MSEAESQLDLIALPEVAATPRQKTSLHVAAVRPVLAVPHLDRDFEYEIPESMASDVRFGVAGKVRFGGQDVTGYVVDVRDTAEHPGELKPLRRIVSPTPVLSEHVWEAAQDVAARLAGTTSDVLRLAIPTRHAAAEKALEPARKALGTSPYRASTPTEYEVPHDSAWTGYAGGHALLKHIAAGDSPGAAWNAAAGMPKEQDWPAAIADVVAATRAGGRGSLVVVPNARDVDRVMRACVARLGEHGVVRLTAEDGPSVRYTAFLQALHGMADVVIGTRAAMFAPVQNLGLALWWDDVDTLHAEPRAPYLHVRDVLTIRARLAGAALISGGLVRSVAVQQLVEAGVLMPVEPLARTSARVIVTGDDDAVERSGPAARARIPAQAWAGARRALQRGPVLVQVPRRGYIPALACTRCRTKATCSACHGPLGADGGGGSLRCGWCGHIEPFFTCPSCGAHEARSLVIGADRTAEELGRAFAGVPVRRSGAPHIVDTVSDEPALVIATPGAEPTARGGYAAAILLDAWAFLDRRGLDASERSLHAWATAAALVRPATRGGEIYLCGVPRHTPFPEVEALVRWAPSWFASRELSERADVLLPPVSRMAAVEGDRKAVTAFADALVAQREHAGQFDVLGPLPLGRRHSFDRHHGGAESATEDEPVRYLVRWRDRADMSVPTLLRDVKVTRALKREANVTVRLDPMLDGL